MPVTTMSSLPAISTMGTLSRRARSSSRPLNAA